MKSLLSVLLLLISTCSPAAAQQAKVDLWILSGQSNACGRAKLPGPEPDSRVTMFDPQQAKFVTAQDPLPHMGTTGTGPWVAAAQTVAAESGTPIRMCGFASGGKPIAYWYPGQPGHGGLFPVIDRSGQHADVFLWYQGESDTGGRLTTAEYQRRLTEHIARVRQASASPNLLAVIVQLGPSLRTNIGGYMAIREAQRQFVIHDEHAILVPALGRTLKDTVHLDNAGYRELGREIGRAILRVRHQRPVGNWPGPVLDKAVLQPNDQARNRRTVVAHFAEVRELRDADAADFAVIDAEGTNRCLEVEAGQTTLVFTCAKDVVLPARLIYGFGQRPKAGLTDESGNRAPAVQLQITLGDAPGESVTQLANGAGGRL